MDKILYYPVTPVGINQAFGQNLNAFYAQQGLKGHPGIDFMAYHGQKVFASHDGTCYPMVDDHGGNGIKIIGTDCETIYWHLIQDDAVVHTGQVVKAGDLIAYADNTGTSTGDHLHFGLALNKNVDMNNGYRGYIDPMPYFNLKFAEYINNPPPKFQFTQTLKKGSWSKDVRELQTLLTSLGLYKGVADGIFGNITLASVKTFQVAHNLTPDGIVGKNTNAILNNLIK